MEPVAAPRPDRAVLGAGLIVGSVTLIALSDALIKLVSLDLTLWQIYITRGLVAVPVLLGLLLAGGRRLTFGAPGWVLLRSLFLVLMWIVYYAALPLLSLSVAAVALYTSPLIIALLSAILIGEPVGLKRWVAVVIGFLGVLAVLRPGTEAFSWVTLLPVLGAAFYALAMVLTRQRCQGETALNLALALNLTLIAAGVIAIAVLALWDPSADQVAAYPFVLDLWAPMGLGDWGLMALLGLLIVVYSAAAARAYQVAPPAVVGTFDYAYLISAVVLGVLLFSEVPDGLTVTGLVLITAAGALVVR